MRLCWHAVARRPLAATLAPGPGWAACLVSDDYDPRTELSAEARAALVAGRPFKHPWHEIEPRHAVDVRLPNDVFWGPLTEYGGECPWPWEPQQLVGAPLGQYRCPYCMAMCVAGMPHFDYTPGWDEDDS